MFVDVNGHLLNTVSFGSGGTTLVGLSGWVGNWEAWQQPFELLSRSWRCVSFDHRGGGESPVPLAEITPSGLVDDVFGVMDALGVERCILAGESLGAIVALEAALRTPERFTGLVLVDGAPMTTANVVQPLIDGAKADWEATLAAFIDRCTPEPNVEHLRRWGRDILRRSTGAMAARMFECYLERNAPPPVLADVRVPTLIVHGTADAIVPAMAGRFLAKSIPGAKLLELDGVGHLPTLTRPRELVDAIVSWASAYSAGSR
jgi:pimeloyl-ACP methyl ester carboxylesterase